MKVTTIRKGPRGTTQARPMSDQWPFRCSECGWKRFEQGFLGIEGRHPAACPLHPEADVIEWTETEEGIASGVMSVVNQTRAPLATVLAQTLALADRSTKHGLAIAAVVPLLERWGGLPERQYQHEPTSGPVPGIDS